MPGQSGWPWAPGWAEEPAEPCPEQGEYPWPAVPNPGRDVTDECQACRAWPWTCAFGSSMAHGRATRVLKGQESLPWPGTKACVFDQDWILVCCVERDKVLLLHHWPLSLNLKLFCIALNCSQILYMKIRILVWFLERFKVASGKAVCWQGQLLYKKTLLQ